MMKVKLQQGKQVKLIPSSNEDQVDFSEDNVFSDQPNDTNLDPDQTNDLEHVPDVDDDVSIILPVLKEKSRYDESQVTTSKQVKLIPSCNEDQVDFSEDSVFSDQTDDTNLDPDYVHTNDMEYVSDSEDEGSAIQTSYKLSILLGIGESKRNDVNQVRKKKGKKVPSSYENQVDFNESPVSRNQSVDPDLEHVPDSDDDVSVIFPVLKEKNINVDSENQTKVSVAKTNNDGKRKYDKVTYCKYCGKAEKKITVHLRQHKNEKEVAEYFASTEIKRQQLITLIRNKGNHIHNYKVLKEKRGEIMPVYRPDHQANYTDYQPCYHCFGWFAKSEMWKHKCLVRPSASNEGKGKAKRRGIVLQGRQMLPPVPNTECDGQVNQVLAGLRSGDIETLIKGDYLIIELAKKWCFKLAHDADQYNHIRGKLREVARLVLQFREDTGNMRASLSTLISPKQFLTVVKSVRAVAGFERVSHEYNTPSLALKLGHTLKKASMIKLNESIMMADAEVAQKEAQNFITLIENKWDEEISCHALRTLYQKKRNNPQLLPLTNDVVTLSTYLQAKTEEHVAQLKSMEDSNKPWTELSKIIMTYLIVFNRRRQGEISKMTMEDYSKLKKGESEMVEGQMNQMARWEQDLVKILWRVEITGKRGRTVPVMMTSFIKESMDTLLKYRNDGKISVNPANKYFFAVPSETCVSHLRGCDALRYHSDKCGAKMPELLRSTRLRKHVATMTQLMSLRDNELDVLANYMGHDIRVHRQFYRLPDASIQVAKISKVLFALEGRKGDPFKTINAKSMEDLNLDPEEGTIHLYC